MTWSIYSIATGLFTGRSYGGPASELAANVPPGHAALLGTFDFLSYRVVGGVAVDYQPPAPAPTTDYSWAWNAQQRRWVAQLTTMGLAKLNNKPILAEIAVMEAASLRALREVLLAQTPTSTAATALASLQQTDAAIATRRSNLQREQ